MLCKRKPRLREKSEDIRVFGGHGAPGQRRFWEVLTSCGAADRSGFFEPGIGPTARCSSRSRDHPRETRGGSHHWARGGTPCFAGSLSAFALWLCVCDRAGAWPGWECVGLRPVQPFLSRRVRAGRYPSEGKCLVPGQTGVTCDDPTVVSCRGPFLYRARISKPSQCSGSHFVALQTDGGSLPRAAGCQPRAGHTPCPAFHVSHDNLLKRISPPRYRRRNGSRGVWGAGGRGAQAAVPEGEGGPWSGPRACRHPRQVTSSVC